MVLKILRFVLIGCIGALCFWIYDHYFVQAFHRDVEDAVEQLPKVEVEQILVQSYNQKGMLRFEIYGARGEVREKDGITEVSPIHMIIYDESIPFQRESTILAARGFHHKTHPPYFELVGKVELNTRPHFEKNRKNQYLRKLFTEKLLYYPDLEKFLSPGSFKVIDMQNASIVTGKSLEYYAREERGEVREGFELRSHVDESSLLNELNQGLIDEY